MTEYVIYAMDSLGLHREPLFWVSRDAARDPQVWRSTFDELAWVVSRVTANGGWIACEPRRSV